MNLIILVIFADSIPKKLQKKEEFLDFLKNLSPEFYENNQNLFSGLQSQIFKALFPEKEIEFVQNIQLKIENNSDDKYSILDIRKEWFDEVQEELFLNIYLKIKSKNGKLSPNTLIDLNSFERKIFDSDLPNDTKNKSGWISWLLHIVIFLSIAMIVINALKLVKGEYLSEFIHSIPFFRIFNPLTIKLIIFMSIGILLNFLALKWGPLSARVYLGYLSAFILSAGFEEFISSKSEKDIKAIYFLGGLNLVTQIILAIIFDSKIIGIYSVALFRVFLSDIFETTHGDLRGTLFKTGLLEALKSVIILLIFGILRMYFPLLQCLRIFELGVYIWGQLFCYLVLFISTLNAGKQSELRNDFLVIFGAFGLFGIGIIFEGSFYTLKRMSACFVLIFCCNKFWKCDWFTNHSVKVMFGGILSLLMCLGVKAHPELFVFW